MGSPSGVGSWAFALGGSDEALAKSKDVLLVRSGSEEKLFHIGPLGHGNKLKLLNNMMLGAIDACAAETMALAEHKMCIRDSSRGLPLWEMPEIHISI